LTLKTIDSLKRGVSKARRLWHEGDCGRALAAVERLLKEWPDNPQLLIMRAELAQLQADANGAYALEDARSDLVRAASLDPDSPDALIELGYFSFVHDDDAGEAAKHFDKAVHRCVDLLTQALVGHAEAQAELGNASKASNSLMTACVLAAGYRGSVREGVLGRLKDLMGSALEPGAAPANGSRK